MKTNTRPKRDQDETRELDDLLDEDALRERVANIDQGFEDIEDMRAESEQRIEYFDSPDAAVPARRD